MSPRIRRAPKDGSTGPEPDAVEPDPAPPAVAEPEDPGAAGTTEPLGIDVPLDDAPASEPEADVAHDAVDPAADGATTDAAEELVEAEEAAPGEDDPEPVVQVARDLAAYPALKGVPAIGDPGRQASIIPIAGPESFGVSDTELDFLTVSPFEVRGCSTRGYSHRFGGTPRQDAFAVRETPEHLVIAVADGVSEGPLSHIAAQTAVRGACKLVGDQPVDTDWTKVSGRLTMRIVDEAVRGRLIPPVEGSDYNAAIPACRKHMSTTLVVLVLSRLADADGCFDATLAVLAGDSGIYLVADDAIRSVAGNKSDDGTAITSAVRPLPGAVTPIVSHLRLAGDQALVLVSDGVGDPLGEGDNDLGIELADRWSIPPTIHEFLLDVNFLRATFADDRTAVGVWVLPQDFGPDDEVEPPAE